MVKRFQIIFALAVAFFLAGLIWSYNSPFFLFKVLPGFKNAFTFVEPARDKILGVMDLANPKLWWNRSALDRLELLDFQLSAKDIAALQKETRKSFEKRFHSTEDRNFQKVKLSFKGKTSTARIAIHGTTMPHWSRPKKSLDVKIRKGESYFEGIRKFGLLTPDTRRFLLPLLASRVAKELNLMFPETRIIKAAFNGRESGTFFLEEKIDQDFLERRGKSNYVVVKLSDNWAEDHYTNFFGVVDPSGHHITPFDHEISNLDEAKFKNPDVVYAATDRLFRFIKSGNLDGLRSLVDLDAMARYETFRTIFGKNHDAAGDNQRLVYSLTDGKFRAAARSESECKLLKLTGGSFAYSVNFYNERPILLFVRLNQIPEYRELKYKYLNKFVRNYPTFRKQLEEIINANRDIILYDHSHYFPMAVREKIMNENLEFIDRNIDIVKEALKSARIYINVHQYPSRMEFEIIPDSEIRIKIDIMRIVFEDKNFNSGIRFIRESGRVDGFVKNGILDLKEGIKDKIFMANFDDRLELQRTVFRFGIQFDSEVVPAIKNISFRAVNGATEKLVADGDRYVKISKPSHLDGIYRNSSAENFMAFYAGSFPRMTIEGNKIRFAKGRHEVKSNLIIPEGFDVAVESGADFLMEPDVSFVSFSPVNFHGNADEPVFIRQAQAGKAYGTFAVAGTRENPLSSTIEWLNVGGGSEAFVNGLYFSGGLSLHHVNVVMKNSDIHNNSGDDGVNIKYGKVAIQNSRFSGNFSDQIDCDFCSGTFENNDFFGGDNSNGDGLDLSGSFIKAVGNNFESFNDKGISVGENTRILLMENNVTGSGIGVAVKDLSRAYLINNAFKRNATAVSLYRKKPVFGGGSAFLLENQFEKNNSNEARDLFSSINTIDSNALSKLQIEKINALIASKTETNATFFKKLENQLADTSKKENSRSRED